ncbi:hypothetical protein SGLAM104S_01193 [Streptomyces glaucescens]
MPRGMSRVLRPRVSRSVRPPASANVGISEASNCTMSGSDFEDAMRSAFVITCAAGTLSCSTVTPSRSPQRSIAWASQRW